MTSDDLQILLELSAAATAAILPHFRTSMDISDKRLRGVFDPVTIADRAAEQAMRAIIAKHFPDDAVHGEEFGHSAGTTGTQRLWVLDPIDGTRGFICGLPTWGVLAGLLDGDHPRLGMMHQPYVEETFVGDSKISLLLRNGKQHVLRSSTCEALADARLATTSPTLFSKDEERQYKAVEGRCKVVRYGTDCYAYAMLAAGHIDLVVEAGLNAYDIMPLIPIIEGAGGIITTWDGQTASQGGAIVAAATPALHQAAMKALIA